METVYAPDRGTPVMMMGALYGPMGRNSRSKVKNGKGFLWRGSLSTSYRVWCGERIVSVTIFINGYILFIVISNELVDGAFELSDSSKQLGLELRLNGHEMVLHLCRLHRTHHHVRVHRYSHNIAN